jgi:hypothetical protein
VHASFAIYGGCKGHNGATVSLGQGSIAGVSKKQNIITRSSTKLKIVGVDDIAPQILSMIYFIEAQGYKFEESIFNHGNLSTMIIKTDDNASISKRSKHIMVR